MSVAGGGAGGFDVVPAALHGAAGTCEQLAAGAQREGSAISDALLSAAGPCGDRELGMALTAAAVAFAGAAGKLADQLTWIAEGLRASASRYEAGEQGALTAFHAL